MIKNIKPYDKTGRVNGGEWAKALRYINEHITIRNAEDFEDLNIIYDRLLGKGQIIETSTFRDGGSEQWKLKDGSTIFYDNNLSGTENGYVTVTHPDGTVEKFDPEGNKAN